MKQKKFFQRIYKLLIEYFFLNLYGKTSFLNTSKFKEIKKINVNFINSLNVKKYNYKIINVKDGRVYTNYVENISILFKNFLIKETSLQQIKGRLKNNQNLTLKSGTPKFIRKFDGTMLVLTQGASGHFNYAHWLFDIISKLEIYAQKFDLIKIDYFYLSKLNNFQKETLKILKIDEKKIIDSDKFRHVKVKNLISVTHPNYFAGTIFDAHSKLPEWIIINLRKKFLNLSLKKFKYKKIFIDRSDSTQNHCKIINNIEVIKYLKSQNFNIIQLSKLKFKDQVSIFNNCDLVIAPHGAGLANISFCKKNTKILEIIPKTHRNKVYEKVSKINKLNYKKIELKKIRNNLNGDMYLEISNLKKIIKKF